MCALLAITFQVANDIVDSQKPQSKRRPDQNDKLQHSSRPHGVAHCGMNPNWLKCLPSPQLQLGHPAVPRFRCCCCSCCCCSRCCCSHFVAQRKLFTQKCCTPRPPMPHTFQVARKEMTMVMTLTLTGQSSNNSNNSGNGSGSNNRNPNQKQILLRQISATVRPSRTKAFGET